MVTNFSNFIYEKIDTDTNIIWFEKSNKYIIINDLLKNSDVGPINIFKKINGKKIKSVEVLVKLED